MDYRGSGSWDTWNILAGACVGAGLMYLLDPQGGGRRRALIRDKMIRASRKTRDGAAATARDIQHRAIGMTAELRSSWTEQPVDDEVLLERVRAALGRLTSHPSSIQVTASDGHVILSGPVLASEVRSLLRGIRHVRGVSDVENRMREYASPENVPGLQGGVTRTGRQWPWMHDSWSPTARLIAATAGAAMTVGGIRERNPFGLAIAAAGVGLFARGVTDVGPSRLVCMGQAWRSRGREEFGGWEGSGRQVSEVNSPNARPESEPVPPSPPRRRSQGDELGGVIH